MLRHQLSRPSRLFIARFSSNLPTPKRGELTKQNPKSSVSSPQPDLKVHHRVSYEYPPPPTRKQKPRESSLFKKHFSKLAAFGGLAWAIYAYYYIVEREPAPQEALAANHFTEFVVLHRELVDDDLMLIEIAPADQKVRLEFSLATEKSIWDGKQLWSVQVKHPELQIARKYTPLPLYYMQAESSEAKSVEPLLRIRDNSAPDVTGRGAFVLLVKRYNDGEMSRYIFSRKVGEKIELRGPYIEFKFPDTQLDMLPARPTMTDVPSRVPGDLILPPGLPKPDNYLFLGAGTGIAPAFQCLLSRNPPRGLLNVFYSVRSRSQVPFSRFMLFLEKTGRAKFHIYVDDERTFVNASDLPAPVERKEPELLGSQDLAAALHEVKPSQYVSAIAQQMNEGFDTEFTGAIVCGPPGYVSYVAGNPGDQNERPVGGLLSQKGWTRENVHRMSDT